MDTATVAPPSTVPALLAHVTANRPDHDAVAMVGHSLTYRQLDQASADMARALLAAGAGKGSRIALLAPDGIFWVTAFLASLRIGALLTLVSTLCTPRELAHMLRHSDIQYMISARRFLSHDYAEKLVAAFPAIVSQQPQRIRLEDAPYLRAIWIDDADGIAWAQPVTDLLAMASEPDAPTPAMLRAAEGQVTSGEEAVIVYTSGSTSLPKAVVHTHWNVTRHPPELAKLFLLKPEDRMLPMLPAFWLGGLAMAMQVLSQGATLVYPSAPDIPSVLEALIQCRANRVNGWGDGLTRLRNLAIERGIDVDAIVGLGLFRDADGQLIPPTLQSNILGMSETFAPHSGEPINVRLPAGKEGASGRSVNQYERRVVHPDTGEILATGEQGELQLRGGALMAGFYKKPRNEVFTSDGFYPTGDLVRIDEEGYLTFVARKGDMIKTRAANVSRLEVEAALNALPEVALAVVTGIADPEFGQVVAAAVVPAAGHQPTIESLTKALRDEISSYKVPKRIIFVEENDIPRTATGKLKLHELGELIAR